MMLRKREKKAVHFPQDLKTNICMANMNENEVKIQHILNKELMNNGFIVTEFETGEQAPSLWLMKG